MLAGREDAINQAVKDGKLTQAQADWLIARMKALAPFELTYPFAPGAGRGHMVGGRGPMHGRRGPCVQAPATPEAPSS